MHAPDRQPRASDGPAWSDAADALYRAAQAVAGDSGPGSTATLVQQLAQILGAATVFVAVFTDESRQHMRTLAAVLDGKLLRSFDYQVQGTPSAQVVGRNYRHVARGVAAELPPGSMLAAKGMDSYAAYPMSDRDGQPLGLLVAMDRQPIADATLAEALLKIFAARIAAEIERGRSDEALRSAALAVSSARGDSVFAELVRYLAAILHCEVAFISRHDPEAPGFLRMLAMFDEGRISRDIRYPIAGTPCETVFRQCFRAYPDELERLFPGDSDLGVQCLKAYAGHPLVAPDGTPLGLIAVASRQPLVQLERVQAMLQIFAVRAAAEVERLAANDALRRSEASYRAIFDAAEDAIVIHDWDSGAIIDVNPKACQAYGYSRDEMCSLSLGALCSGVEPYTAERALEHIGQARLGRCAPFEWHCRNRDGSLRWDEVHLKPVMIDGRHCIVAFTRDITERKAALAVLQSQQQYYRAIFDGSVDSMVLWGEDLRVVDVNRAFVLMTGMSREAVIGKHWRDRPDARDMLRLVGYIERALRGEEVQAIETVERDDGTPFEIELRYLPVQLGDKPYALGVGRDVSERLERERALQRSEAQYRDIFNASTDSLVLRDANFRIVDVNATYETMSGYTRDEVLGAERVFANPADVAPTIRALHQRALEGEPVVLETRLVHRNGARYHLELRGVPVQHGGAPHVLYIGRDITERKRAEQALRDSEEQYRAIFNASADGVVLRDAEFRAVDVNPAYLAMSGYTREEVLSSSQVLTQPDPLVRQQHRAQHQQILAGKPVRFEASGLRKDGSAYHVEVNGMPVAYRGRPHVLYAARDITERRLAEERRAELEHQLRQAQKMEAIGQLTGGIAHDFNNILTSVIGYLVLGQERADRLGDAALQRQLGQAHLAAQRARELIAQMLAFARRQRGERRVLALAPLVGQALQLLRATLPSSVSLDYPVVALEAEAQVHADPVQLEQVLFNLCINARDAITGPGLIRVHLGERGGGWHCASCRARVDAGRWVELSVADNGSGIAPDLLERVFEPFTSTKEVGRGSGMGLAMVHGIVHDHGGHVVVATAPGAGSVFSVLLPPARGATAVEPALAAPPAPAGSVRGRVMVVDDEAMVGEFMGELLSGWDIEVVVQREPMQALAWLADRDQPLDLLITDQTMPQLQGLQLAERAVALRPGLPVVLYTGNADGIDEAEAMRHGVRAMLRKPVDVVALRALMQRCLKTH